MYFSKKLSKFNKIKHCFFSKNGGVSNGVFTSLNCGLGSSDEKKNILDNLSIVSKKMGIHDKNLFLMNQTHSNKVIVVGNENKKSQIINSDALITRLKNISISVLTADCVPILIYDEINQIIACIHSGWRGAVNGIIENTLKPEIKMNL